MRRQKGFTIIELLVVVAILGILTAIAIPGLRRARQRADQASAVQSLRTLTTSEYLYYSKSNSYGDLTALGANTVVDSVLASGTKSNYKFVVTAPPGAKTFTITATPISEAASLPHYFVDETTVIRFNDGAPAHAGSTPIPQ